MENKNGHQQTTITEATTTHPSHTPSSTHAHSRISCLLKPSTRSIPLQMQKSSTSSVLIRIHLRSMLPVEGDLGVRLGR